MICSSERMRPGTLARTLLRLAAVLALVSTAGAQKIKLATLVPDGSIWDRTLKEMGAQWQKDTGGKVSLRIYAGGVAGDETDMARKLKIGQIHAGLFTASGLGQIEPAFRIFEIPLLFENDDEANFVIDAVRADFEKRLDDAGYVLVHWGHGGWMRIFSTKPIRRYQDFLDMKQFVWGGGSRVGGWYEEKGIRTVPISTPDMMTALQTGLVEVVPATPIAALSLQWFRSAPFMFERRLAPLIGGTIVSKKAWKKIPAAQQEKLLAAGREATRKLFEEVPRSEEEALTEMQKRGLEITHVAGEADGRLWDELGLHFRTRMSEESIPPDVFRRVTGLIAEYRAKKE